MTNDAPRSAAGTGRGGLTTTEVGPAGVRLGEEVGAILDGRASVVVVDLDQAERHVRAVPLAFAGVVIGVSRTGWPAEADAQASAGGRSDLSHLDIVLVPEQFRAAGRSLGAPWVAVDDLDAELARIREATERSPIAAVTLMHVLRAGVASSVEHDLLVESLAYSELQAGDEHARWLAERPAPRPRAAEVGPAVLLERDGGVLTITLHRPEVRNAYNVAVRDGLYEAFELVALDPSIETVDLKGAGPSFCSGGDLDEFGTGPGPAVSHLIRTSRGPARGLARVAERVVAHLHGACVGAGIELPALAGRVVAAPDTRFRLPEVAMGLIPGAGGTASIPRRIGRHRTAWLALGGAWLDSATAHRWGLVDEVEDPASR